MKPAFMQTVTIETALLALACLGAQAQKASPGRLPAPRISSCTRIGTNLVWQPSDKISLGLVAQNLLKNLHQEYAGPDLTVLPSLVRRSAYARLIWRF